MQRSVSPSMWLWRLEVPWKFIISGNGKDQTLWFYTAAESRVYVPLGSFIGSNFGAVHLTFIGHHRASLLPATGPGSNVEWCGEVSVVSGIFFWRLTMASWFLPTKPVPHKGAACCSGNCRRNLKPLGRMIGKLATWLQLWSPRVGLRPSFKCCRLPSVKLPYVGLLPL